MRYIDADKLLESVTKNDFNDWLDYDIFQHLLEEAPTADVVPKSEVERLEHICNSYALQYGTVRDQQKVIDEAKAEVAREIFEEIDQIFRKKFESLPKIEESELFFPALESERFAIKEMWKRVAELKKKYTEVPTDERN